MGNIKKAQEADVDNESDEEDTIEDEMVELSKNHAASHMEASASSVRGTSMQREDAAVVFNQNYLQNDDTTTIVGMKSGVKQPFRQKHEEYKQVRSEGSSSSWSEMMDMSENLHSKFSAAEAKPQQLNKAANAKQLKNKVGIPPSKFLKDSPGKHASVVTLQHNRLGSYGQANYNMMPGLPSQQKRVPPQQPSAFLTSKLNS